MKNGKIIVAMNLLIKGATKNEVSPISPTILNIRTKLLIEGKSLRHYRPGSFEFADGVRRLQKDNFHGFQFCRVCPKNKVGYDDLMQRIPLEAHHAAKPYALDHNQDPTNGVLVCRQVHIDQIHIPHRCGLAEPGKRLSLQFIANPVRPIFDIGVTCPYKPDQEEIDYSGFLPSFYDDVV